MRAGTYLKKFLRIFAPAGDSRPRVSMEGETRNASHSPVQTASPAAVSRARFRAPAASRWPQGLPPPILERATRSQGRHAKLRADADSRRGGSLAAERVSESRRTYASGPVLCHLARSEEEAHVIVLGCAGASGGPASPRAAQRPASPCSFLRDRRVRAVGPQLPWRVP
jgi:hypothetical protein